MKFLFLQTAFSLKICTNCEFFHQKLLQPSKFGKCTKFPIPNEDPYFLVNGIRTVEQDYNYCSTAREFDHLCGKDAIYFKKKGV